MIDEAERWRRRYERERAARRSAEQLAADTLSRLHLQLEAERTGNTRSLEEQKAEFLNVVSHELRTPLTILRGGLHVLERNTAGEDPSVAQLLGTVTRASDRLIRIVQNVEVSARLRDATHQWGLTSIAVRALAQQVVDDVAPDRQVRIEDDVDAAVLASPELLRASLANLLQNAVTYGAPPFIIRTSLREAAVEVRMIDHGAGLPDDRADLFRDFAQGDIGDRRTSRGLGLGLSIVVGAAVRGGWHVAHHRDDDDASVFLMRLPNAQATHRDDLSLVAGPTEVQARKPPT